MGLEDLADVHPARHAERVEHEVDRRAVLEIGHVLVGHDREITPLLPWRPAILSPGWSLRFTAMKTLTIFITPGGSSSPRCSFSTLSSNRLLEPACEPSSNCLFSASISAFALVVLDARSATTGRRGMLVEHARRRSACRP